MDIILTNAASQPIYDQIVSQVKAQILSGKLKEGDALPSVRQLADTVGINMHTVNKAYTVLKQEGFIRLDRRKGAVIALDVDKAEALLKMRENLRILLAKG